jgi:hypothetical protein
MALKWPALARGAGIDHAKQEGGKAYLGRKPSFNRGQFAKHAICSGSNRPASR